MPPEPVIAVTDDWRCQAVVGPEGAVCGADSQHALIPWQSPYEARPVCEAHAGSAARSDDRLIGRRECRQVQETMIARKVMKHRADRIVDAGGRIWAPQPDWTAKPRPRRGA